MPISNVRIFCEYQRRVVRIVANTSLPEWLPMDRDVALLYQPEDEARYQFLIRQAPEGHQEALMHFWCDIGLCDHEEHQERREKGSRA